MRKLGLITLGAVHTHTHTHTQVALGSLNGIK